MADAREDLSFDPLAFDYARNAAELGGGIPIYVTTDVPQGGILFSPSTSQQYFGQTLSPIIESAKSPWLWIFVAFGVLIAVTMKSRQ